MKKQLLFFLILFCLPVARSQSSRSEWPSLSFHGGAFVTAQKYFANAYGSKSGIIYGGAVEFPVVEHLRLTGKLSYFFRSANSFEWRQWLTFTGLKYERGMIDDLSATVSAGMALTIFLDTQPEVTVIGRTTGNMIPGFFGGIGAEYPVSSFPLTVFIEAEYSSITWNFPGYTYNYGGTGLTAGLRYHFIHEADK